MAKSNKIASHGISGRVAGGYLQGVIFPAGVWVFPTGNLQHLTGFTGNFSPNSRVFVVFESSRQLT